MENSAVLFPFNAAEVDILINCHEFVIGRAKHVSYDIKDVSISRTHCILSFRDSWTICDKSSAGTWLNGKQLKVNESVPLSDSDHIKLGASGQYMYIFCTGGHSCPRSCYLRAHNGRTQNTKYGLDAELAQRRRLFEYRASLQKDGLEKSILEKQQDRKKLEQQQKLLRHSFNQQLQILEEKNRQLRSDLEEKSSSSGSNLSEEREELEKQFRDEKLHLENMHVKETSELASKILAFEAAESELKKQNNDLLERLEHEKQQFELRLEEERKVLENKLAEQLVEQKKLAAEKAEVEEALRRRTQDLEKMTHLEVEQQQQRLVERAKEEERLSKEKLQFEERLLELQNVLQEKERQEKEREKALLERDLELRAQEEQRERERKEREERMEAEFQAKKRELEELERKSQLELRRREEEVTKELQDREAELQRKTEEQVRELEAKKLEEQERLRKELEKREQEMRQQLESEMSKLQQKHMSLELSIRAELSKKEGESAEILEKLSSELNQVKRDLDTTTNKRTLLEKELEEASKAKEAASQSGLQARKDVIENFGELVESELQCSICNELFVTATTLNCNHTFCSECITEWLKKKKDCPICRRPCTQQSRSLVLDNFIDRMVENLSEDLKKRRKEIIEERKANAQIAADSIPNKKRKTSGPSIPMPLQVVNGNVINAARLVAVSSVPAGAPVIQVRSNTPVAGQVRTYQVLAASLTSQAAPTPPQAVATAPQLRLQALQQQRAPLAHPSSSAQNQMMIQRPAQISPGVRTRGGATPRPVAARPGTYVTSTARAPTAMATLVRPRNPTPRQPTPRPPAPRFHLANTGALNRRTRP